MPCLQSMIGDELRSSSKAARSKQERQQVSAALHNRVHQHFGTAEPSAGGAVPAMRAETVSESDGDEPAAGAAEWAGQQATYSEVNVALKVRHLWPACGQCISLGPDVWLRLMSKAAANHAGDRPWVESQGEASEALHLGMQRMPCMYICLDHIRD